MYATTVRRQSLLTAIVGSVWIMDIIIEYPEDYHDVAGWYIVRDTVVFNMAMPIEAVIDILNHEVIHRGIYYLLEHCKDIDALVVTHMYDYIYDWIENRYHYNNFVLHSVKKGTHKHNVMMRMIEENTRDSTGITQV